MSKKFKIILLVVISILIITCSVSCAKWEQIKKNWSSNAAGGLNRHIRVVNLVTGDIIWENIGKSYIDGKSEVGDVTIIYYDEVGNSKKVDFIGNFYGVEAIEL